MASLQPLRRCGLRRQWTGIARLRPRSFDISEYGEPQVRVRDLPKYRLRTRAGSPTLFRGSHRIDPWGRAYRSGPSPDHDLFDSAVNNAASRRRACNIRVLTVFTGHATIFAISAYDRS